MKFTTTLLTSAIVLAAFNANAQENDIAISKVATGLVKCSFLFKAFDGQFTGNALTAFEATKQEQSATAMNLSAQLISKGQNPTVDKQEILMGYANLKSKLDNLNMEQKEDELVLHVNYCNNFVNGASQFVKVLKQ